MLSPFFDACPKPVFYVAGNENVFPGLLVEHKPVAPVDAETIHRSFLRVRDNAKEAIDILDKTLRENVTRVAYVGSDGWTKIPDDRWSAVYGVLKLHAFQVIVGASGASKIPAELVHLVAKESNATSEEIAKK